ncbi:MAG TPA: cytochrome c oxidase subunit I [Thermoanaerobaculia bacterium]|nr:cytochrome c oxidase subunit I [Thermoanaerobaculia bacterium]
MHGALAWLRDVDHKHIGRRYVVTAFVWFALAGAAALLMRLQLMRPEGKVVGPDLYDQLFTMHGTSMMFLFAVPVMGGMGIYLVPLMVGTRNVAFPRLNALGYYLFLIAGLMLWGSFFVGMGPDAGWFAYVPLSTAFSPGKRVDLWAQLISLTEISALIVAVEIIVTAFKQRAPGMTLDRMPLFVWAQVVTQFMVIFAMPAVMLGTTFIALDRLVATQLFNYTEGGDALLWQHLFWFFGHPEVYIIFIPALGFVSSIVAASTRRPVFGYPAMVASLVATGFVAFGLWVHHMFTTGLPQLGESFFTAASMIISIPTGVQIFCWLATIWTGRLVLRVPMLYVFGFFSTFVIGGLTGVILASVPIDTQVHDTFFVVAHLHYVLIGGAIFPLLGAVVHWFPKMTGRMTSERLGRWSFAFVFTGFHLTFFPMHLLGLYGMPRRVYTYLPQRGWGDLNFLSTVGSWVLGVGVLLFVVNALWSMFAGARAGADPWAADTLEWATESPPPPYGFLHLPIVTGREGLWSPGARSAFVTGLDPDKTELLVTNLLDAEPELRYFVAGPSIAPLFTALSIAFVFATGMFTPWGPVVGMVPLFLSLLGWIVKSEDGERGGERPSTASPPAGDDAAALSAAEAAG